MQLKYKETLGRGRGEGGAGVLTSGYCDEGGAGRRRGRGGVRGGVEVGGRGGVEGAESAWRPTGDGGGESGESWIWGKVAWGRTNPVVKSEVAVARSGKSVVAILATSYSLIHATATPFSFPPFFI